MIPHFTTERLSAELINEQHTEFIQRLVNSEGWLNFIGDRNIHSHEEAAKYIQKIRDTADFFYWVVSHKATHEPLGIVSLLKRDYLDHFDIGFAFLPQYVGKGYAYEATHFLLTFIKNDLKLETVLATTLPANTQSIKLLTKLNFKFTKEIVHEGKRLCLYSW